MEEFHCIYLFDILSTMDWYIYWYSFVQTMHNFMNINSQQKWNDHNIKYIVHYDDNDIFMEKCLLLTGHHNLRRIRIINNC